MFLSLGTIGKAEGGVKELTRAIRIANRHIESAAQPTDHPIKWPASRSRPSARRSSGPVPGRPPPGRAFGRWPRIRGLGLRSLERAGFGRRRFCPGSAASATISPKASAPLPRERRSFANRAKERPAIAHRSPGPPVSNWSKRYRVRIRPTKLVAPKMTRSNRFVSVGAFTAHPLSRRQSPASTRDHAKAGAARMRQKRKWCRLTGEVPPKADSIPGLERRIYRKTRKSYRKGFRRRLKSWSEKIESETECATISSIFERPAH